MVRRILLIDDDVEITTQINQILMNNGFVVTVANTPQQALDALVERYEYVLCDYAMGQLDVFSFFSQLKEIQPQVILLLMSGFQGLKCCAPLTHAGVSDVVLKPIVAEELLAIIKQAKVTSNVQKITTKDLASVINDLNEADFTNWVSYDSTQIIDAPLVMFEQQLSALWQETDTLLLQSEPHCGLGNIIYNNAKNDNPTLGNIIHVNCKAMLSENMYKTLFGYEKGAFIGAFSTSAGVLEQVADGVLVLNGIEFLSSETQIALVTAFEKGYFTRIGSTNQLSIKFKLVGVTSKLQTTEELRQQLRPDFLKLLKSTEHHMSTLAQRKKDIVANAILFLQRINKKYELLVEDLNDNVIQLLLSYNWPGNWSELYFTLRRAAFLCNDVILNVNTLPHEIIFQNNFSTTGQQYKLVIKQNERDVFSVNHIARVNEQLPNLKTIAAEAELETINRVLHSVKFNKTKAAKILGVDRKTLYNKMMKHKIGKLADKN